MNPIDLNLLPPDRQHDLHQAGRLRHWSRAAVVLASTTILITLVTTGIWWHLQSHQKDVHAQYQAELQRADKTAAGDITKATTKVNEAVTILRQAIPSARNWSTDLDSVLKIVPANIALSKFDLTNTGNIRFEGVALSRSSFLAFDAALRAAPNLLRVSTTATASKRENIPFVYTASLAPAK